MFAAVHQEEEQQLQLQQQQQQRPRLRHVVHDDSPSVITSSGSGLLPGAYAEGGRIGTGAADDTYTLSPQESVAPIQEERRRDPNEGLPMLSAVAVDDDDENNHPPEDDTPVFEAEEKQEPSWLAERRTQYVLLALFLLLIGIVVTVVIFVTGDDAGGGTGSTKNPQSGQPGDDTTLTPTSSPSVSPAPTSFYDRIFDVLSAYSGEEVLLDSSTPQSQAFQWTLGDFEVGDWSDDEVLQRYALGSLFYSTDGLRWLTVTDSLLQVPYCEWDGVGCTNGTLTALSLPSENLVGTIPREIGLLTSLTLLDASGNSLTGSLPTEIGFLTNLEEMDLSYDAAAADIGVGSATRSLRRSLEDTIPESSSNLRGPIPSEIGLLTSLVTLDLSGNNISGSIPPEIGQLDNIRTLSLRRNLLQGAIPLQLGFLTSLERVSLETNLLTGGVPISLCSSLTMIQELSSDCLEEVNGDKPAEVVCKCCNVCCDVNDVCQDLDVTSFPSASPSSSPSTTPSSHPSFAPSGLPSLLPSSRPSFLPSMPPSLNPTPSGTPAPTVAASQSPSKSPTLDPSTQPSLQPTTSPTITWSTPPTVSCRIDENSCVGNRACNGAVQLCTASGSCSGRNACRSATDLSVAQGSCVGTSTKSSPLLLISGQQSSAI